MNGNQSEEEFEFETTISMLQQGELPEDDDQMVQAIVDTWLAVKAENTRDRHQVTQEQWDHWASFSESIDNTLKAHLEAAANSKTGSINPTGIAFIENLGKRIGSAKRVTEFEEEPPSVLAVMTKKKRIRDWLKKL